MVRSVILTYYHPSFRRPPLCASVPCNACQLISRLHNVGVVQLNSGLHSVGLVRRQGRLWITVSGVLAEAPGEYLSAEGALFQLRWGVYDVASVTMTNISHS